MAAQAALARLGYNPGIPDVLIGLGTRQALRAWQRDRGLPAGEYALQVTRADTISAAWNFALAWQLQDVPQWAAAANGCAAFGHYKPGAEGGYTPWALQVLEISGDRIVGIHSFLDAEHLFPVFGLPPHLPA